MMRCPQPGCDGSTFRLTGIVEFDVVCDVETMPDGTLVMEPQYIGPAPDNPEVYDDTCTCLTCNEACSVDRAFAAYEDWEKTQTIAGPNQLPLLT